MPIPVRFGTWSVNGRGPPFSRSVQTKELAEEISSISTDPSSLLSKSVTDDSRYGCRSKENSALWRGFR